MKFAATHEWVKVDNEIGTVGVSIHAQQELGEVVYVELPDLGKIIAAGEEVAVLESTKAAADVYSPVSGTIIAVNEELKNQPDLINKAAEGEGWIYRIALSHPKEVDALMEDQAYRQQFA